MLSHICHMFYVVQSDDYGGLPRLNTTSTIKDPVYGGPFHPLRRDSDATE